MRVLLFPGLEQLNSLVNGRSTGDKRYSWKNVIYSLKSTSVQKDQRREIAAKVDKRIDNMKSSGLSTITSIGDLAQPHIRQLYINFIILLNSTYQDYDFSFISPDSFLPTTNQNFLDTLTNDVFVPLSAELPSISLSLSATSNDPTDSTNSSTVNDLKFSFIHSLKEAIGFDLASPAPNASNASNASAILLPTSTLTPRQTTTMEDVPQSSAHADSNNNILLPPLPDPTVALPASSHPGKDYFIFELDNDGDNPLFSLAKLWTKVFVIYNVVLKRVAITAVSCKSTQSLYSPALLPLAGQSTSVAIGLQDDNFSLRSGHSGGGSTHDRRKKRAAGHEGNNDDDDDDDDDDESGQGHLLHRSTMNNDDPFRNNNDGDRSDNDELGGYTSDTDDDFYLYNPAIVPVANSVGYHSNGVASVEQLSSGIPGGAVYTNHVELVETANGDIEIVPLLLNPRQLAQAQRESSLLSHGVQQTPDVSATHVNLSIQHNTKTPDFQPTK